MPPAKAGVHGSSAGAGRMDSGLRREDGVGPQFTLAGKVGAFRAPAARSKA